MKAIKVALTSLFIILIMNGFAFGEAASSCKKWNGQNNPTGYIWREGLVGINEMRVLLNDVADGTKILRGNAGHLRIQYNDNVYFDALENGFFQIRYSDLITPAFSVKPDGNAYLNNSGPVGIGTSEPDPNFKMHIAGKLRVDDEIVIPGSGADFVFAKNYPLMSLDELEQHIKEKRHLPNFPSAEKMQANGMNVGEMQTKLLQKVEEFTLYILAQRKENEQLKARVASLEARVASLESANH